MAHINNINNINGKPLPIVNGFHKDRTFKNYTPEDFDISATIGEFYFGVFIPFILNISDLKVAKQTYRIQHRIQLVQDSTLFLSGIYYLMKTLVTS